MKRFLLFQAYGLVAIYQELLYSVYSIIKLYQGRPPFEIVIYTDDSAYFQARLPAWVKYELLDKARQKEWAGSIQFVHRVKIMVLLDFMKSHRGSLIYADTDTFFTDRLEPIYEWIEQGDYAVHVAEGQISSRSNLTLRRLDSFLKKHPDYAISRDQMMYNAGLLGLLSQNIEVVEEVLELTDQLYPIYHRHIVEQLAFSHAFATHGQVKEAYQQVYHYWGFKEFRKALQDFFDFNANVPHEALIEKIDQINPIRLHQPKLAYERLSFWPKTYRKLLKKRWKFAEYRLE